MITNTLVEGDTASGYPSLLIVRLFSGEMPLIALGTIGKYIGRVFNETKQRPLYLPRTVVRTTVAGRLDEWPKVEQPTHTEFSA